MTGISTTWGADVRWTRVQEAGGTLVHYDPSMQGVLNGTQSAGRIAGGAITDNLDGTIAVAITWGMIKTTADEVLGETKLVVFPAAAALDVSVLGTLYWVYGDYAAGTPALAVTATYADITHTTRIEIATLYRDADGDLHILAAPTNIVNFARRVQRRFNEVYGAQRATGDIIGAPGTLGISLTAGIYYYNVTRLGTAAFDSTVIGDDFDYYYRGVGVGTWTEVPAQWQIDALNYDDGTGVLAALGAGEYGVHWVYRTYDGFVVVQYGQASYATLVAAREAQPPATVPNIVEDFGYLVGKAIVLNGAADLQEVQSAFGTPFAYSAPTQHNWLAGLQGGIAGQRWHLPAGVQGDVPYHDGTDWKALLHGNQYQMLMSNGHAANPQWNDVEGGIPGLRHVPIYMRTGTAAAWAAANPVLGAGEWGFASDAWVVKIGNNALTWNALPHMAGLINSGTATVLAGATRTNPDIAHGLPVTPLPENIHITPTDDLGGRSFWVTDVGAATFRINMNPNDLVNHVFGWQVVI